jgi:hypothetical protein
MDSAEVERRLLSWANAKALPPASVQKWLALDERGRARLLEIAEHLKMHTGQMVAAIALLEEISMREGRDAGAILGSESLRRVLNSAGSGPGRARDLLDELRLLRYPRLRSAIERLAKAVAALKLPPEIKIVLPRELASDEVRIEIVAHGSSEMERLLACLTANSSELVRLAAMLAGADDGSADDS